MTPPPLTIHSQSIPHFDYIVVSCSAIPVAHLQLPLTPAGQAWFDQSLQPNASLPAYFLPASCLHSSVPCLHALDRGSGETTDGFYFILCEYNQPYCHHIAMSFSLYHSGWPQEQGSVNRVTTPGGVYSVLRAMYTLYGVQ